MADEPERRFLTRRDLAARWKVTAQTVHRQLKSGRIPPALRFSPRGVLRWEEEAIVRWERERLADAQRSVAEHAAA